MSKRELATWAVIGITAATSACQRAKAQEEGKQQSIPSHPQQQDMGHQHRMSAQKEAFYNSLSSGGKKKFMELDSQHQHMAMEMADQSCNGKNSCAGMGGCKSAYNACAGKNSCKGQGGEPVNDPNKAVMIQHLKQYGKR